MQAIEEKRDQLIDLLRKQRDTKLRRLKEEQVKCTGKLQQTTGLIQFCIEALKEVDAASFLQVGDSLISRVANTDLTWRQEITDAAPRVSPVVGFSLDDLEVVKAVEGLSFINGKWISLPTPASSVSLHSLIPSPFTRPQFKSQGAAASDRNCQNLIGRMVVGEPACSVFSAVS